MSLKSRGARDIERRFKAMIADDLVKALTAHYAGKASVSAVLTNTDQWQLLLKLPSGDYHLTLSKARY